MRVEKEKQKNNFGNRIVEENKYSVSRAIIFSIIILSLFFSNPAFASIADSTNNSIIDSDNNPIADSTNDSTNELNTNENSNYQNSIYFEDADVDTTPSPSPENALTSNTSNVQENGTGDGIEDGIGDGIENGIEKGTENVLNGENKMGLDDGTYCSTTSLTDKEAKKIIDLKGEGFEGKEIADEKEANGTDIEGVELVGSDNDGKTAIKVKPPSKASTPADYSFFHNKTINGAFGIGLVLDDTLRVGRCDEEDQDLCRINGRGLEYRTSGKGTSSSLVNVSSSFKESIKGKFSGLEEEEYEKMKNQMYDENNLEVKTVTVEPTDQIPNSFKTREYSLRNATTCNNNSCIISTYSAFDKLFNSWFSSEMVVSVFGPTLLSSAGKVLGVAGHGPSGGSKMFKKVNKWVDKVKSSNYAPRALPSTIIGKRRVDAYQSIQNNYGLKPIFDDMLVNPKAFSSGAQGYVSELLEENSKIMKLSPEQKRKFYDALVHLRSYSHASKTQMSGLQEAYQQAVNNPAVDNGDALKKFARGVAEQMQDWDDATFLDFPKWMQKNPDLTGLGSYAVKRKGFPASDGFVDVTTGDTFWFTKGILREFGATGNWDNYATTNDFTQYVYETAGDAASSTKGLQLYKLMPENKIKEGVSVADLQEYLAKLGNNVYYVDVPGRGKIPLNNNSLDLIKSSAGTGAAVDIFEGKYAPAKVLTPKEFANTIAQDRIVKRPGTAYNNLSDLEINLRKNPAFNSRRSFSGMDELFKKEKNLVKDYYTLKANQLSFIKVALGPMAYWNVKRGFGNENYSAFMLPDSWTTLTLSQGSDKIYNDSYVDIYSNEGSDQGDIFSRVMNNAVLFFPNEVIKAGVEQFSPTISEKIDSLFGEGGLKGNIMRDEVKDIAFYSHNENCSDCTTSLNLKDNYLSATIKANSDLDGYIVEAVGRPTINEEGSTLITYTHHSNIHGSTGEVDGEKIDLVEARLEGTTCEQKVKDSSIGWAGTTETIGGTMAVTESLAYFIHPGFGLLASGAQQFMIAPELQDCVDDKEGYYTHFYVPPSNELEETKSKGQKSGESVSNTVSKMSSDLKNMTTDTNNPVGDQLNKLKDDFQNFTKQVNNMDVLQASINLKAPALGNLKGKEIFYVWYKDYLMPSGLRTSGRAVTKDGDNVVVEDYGKGDIEINGETVVDDKREIVGLTTPDNRMPTKVVPRKVATAAIPYGNSTIIRVNSFGQVFVENSSILSCIKNAIKEQTNIELSGDELTQAFGSLKLINTSMYQNISAGRGKINLEGEGLRHEGKNANFIIKGNLETELVENTANGKKAISSGELVGITFKNGTIVVNESKNGLVVWIRHHNDSILNTEEVSSMNVNRTSIKDPESECEQPAFEFGTTAYPGDEVGQKKVKNFNASMKNLGPFSQFTTESKMFEFYSKRDDSGACKDYFRVIDRETGEVIEEGEIVGGIKKDDEGNLVFSTGDGKSHKLSFDAENGIPKLQYNDGPTETLRNAQGLNGSFWFDPNTGQWYPENGLQIPLGEAFKKEGTYYGTDEKGNLVGNAGNPMTFNIGTDEQQGFNIPSLPQNPINLFLFISLFMVIAFISTRTKFKIKK